MYSTGVAAAYTSDSFVVDTDPYLFESIQASSFSLRSTASTYSVSALAASESVSSLPLNSTLPVLSSSSACTFIGQDPTNTAGWNTEIVRPSFSNFTVLASKNLYSSAIVSVPDDPDYDWHTVLFPDNQIDLTYDVSSLNSSCLQFNGIFTFRSAVKSGPKWYYSSGFDMQIIINGDLQKTYYSSDQHLDLAGWIFDSSSPINEVTFRIIMTDAIGASIPDNTSSVQLGHLIYNTSTASIDGLSDDDVLSGFNNNAQDAINQQDSLEAQWTGSMTENFNNLSLAGFDFPVGAVNGFSLISGIFNDLWNAMGDFRIAYVFPLLLGVVLLLIGRLSRDDLKSSSGWGDEDV